MKLSPTEERFILHWGEMGSRWGVNRTVAQIHALLFIADEALCADEIVETLSVARSNVSMSLKELQGWDLVQTVNKLGDRRDHFTTFKDVWEIFDRIVEGRRKRELDPTLTVLRQMLMEEDPELSKGARGRLSEVLEFLEMLTSWHRDAHRLPRSVISSVMKMGAGISKLTGGGKH